MRMMRWEMGMRVIERGLGCLHWTAFLECLLISSMWVEYCMDNYSGVE